MGNMMSDDTKALEEHPERRDWYERLDPGIRQIVRILAENGVDTCQSCAGSGPFGEQSGKRNGDAHSYIEPTVEFYGSASAGFAALSIAMQHRLPVVSLRRLWNIEDGEPVGPIWSMTFNLSPHELVGWLAPGCAPYEKMHHER